MLKSLAHASSASLAQSKYLSLLFRVQGRFT